MRLKSSLWVSAYLRRAMLSGAFGAVARHGDDDAGPLRRLTLPEGIVESQELVVPHQQPGGLPPLCIKRHAVDGGLHVGMGIDDHGQHPFVQRRQQQRVLFTLGRLYPFS